MKMRLLTFVILLVFIGVPAMAGRESSMVVPSKGDELTNWAGYGEEKLSTVVISGRLLCHGRNGKAAIPPRPVSGASVDILCGGSENTRTSWAKGTTNGYGEFLIDLPSHLHAIPNLEKICVAKVVHMPKSSACQNSLARECVHIKLTSIGEGIRTYRTDNINLTLESPRHARRKEGRSRIW